MPKLGLIFTFAIIACQLASGSVLPAPESSPSPGFSPDQMNQLSGICFTAFRIMLDQTLTQQHVKPIQGAIQHEEKVTPRKVIPQGFEQIGTRFFYISVDIKMNWFAAERTCRQMGGELATIQDEVELNAIKEKVSESSDNYWLNLNDLETNGEYVSWTSGKMAPFYNWHEPQSENEDNNAHCVTVFNGEMFLDPCERTYPFICQAVEDS